MAKGYDAFISYSHAADAPLAAALERIPAIEPQESPETPAEPQSDTYTPPESQEPVEPRPWWRRLFHSR